MSFEGVKSFAASHLSLSGFKNDCKKLYGKIFGKLVHVLEGLTTVLDKVKKSPRTDLAFNQSIYKRKTNPWSVKTRLHYWHLERNEHKARSLMNDFLENLVERGAGIEDLSSDKAKALTSELMEILIELDATVFKAFSIAEGRKASPDDLGLAMRALFDEVEGSIVGNEKLKAQLGEKGFLYKFVCACAKLNFIDVDEVSENDKLFKTRAINCLSVEGLNFLHSILMLHYEMTDSELPDEKESLQKQISKVSADDEDILPMSQIIFNRFRI
ncbi:hypothetical protein [Endozoicomonas sp. 4G]|uniref:hypothetical protein n=1 Tax=Endozoicomonas sp. 4G TaxID=2872754 RepID=UPI002078699B|nr:hypothetical protein [Endozoicomonas sp. 4G]